MNFLRIAPAVLLSVVATTASAQVRFSAADVASKKAPAGRKLAIRNTSNSITAYQFFGDIQKALFSLKSSRPLVTRRTASFYDSSARVTALPENLSMIMHEAATRYGLDPRLIAAVAHQESRYNPTAVSPVGAMGMMQLMPQTAKYLGVSNPFDARENVMGGARYLKTLLDTFDGDLDLTLAAYNAGPGAVRRYRGVPPYQETMNYVASIKKNYQSATFTR
jgi:soluble lytic murein transglycosylase-like protein